MRLLHITATHLNPAGGIPVVLRKLVIAQNEIEGFDARVLSVKASVDRCDCIFFDFLEDRTLDDYIEKFVPDVVIFHSHYCFRYIKLYKVLIKKKIPYLIEPHGSFGKEAIKKSRIKKTLANTLIFKQFINRAKAFVFLNEIERKDALYQTDRDLVIPNGITTDKINYRVERKNSFRLYFIGRYDIHHKGLDCLFDALDILEKKQQHITVELYGTGSEAELSYINKRIKRYNSLTVMDRGAIYNSEQKETLEQHGVMILTSRYEGFPMTVLEAWGYGNPCLVTPGTNMSEETQENSLGWRVDLSAESIADGILSAKNDYEKNGEQYAKNCKEYVTKNYSWQKIAMKSYKELKKVI